MEALLYAALIAIVAIGAPLLIYFFVTAAIFLGPSLVLIINAWTTGGWVGGFLFCLALAWPLCVLYFLESNRPAKLKEQLAEWSENYRFLNKGVLAATGFAYFGGHITYVAYLMNMGSGDVNLWVAAIAGAWKGLVWLAFALPGILFIAVAHNYATSLFLSFPRSKEKTVGSPTRLHRHWRRQTGPTCAIGAQRMVLAAFGIDRTIEQLADIQRSYGAYNDREGSTSICLLLEAAGLKVTKRPIKKNSKQMIWRALSKGRLIILPVNAQLINNPDSLRHPNEKPVIDHVIVLTALTYGGKEPQVSYADTGVDNGWERRTTLAQVLAATRGDGYAVLTPPVPP